LPAPTDSDRDAATDCPRTPWPAVTVVAALLALMLPGCAVQRDGAARLAEAQGLRSARVHGAGFEHVVRHRGGLGNASGLHVYLEGDGRPWATPTRVSADPTPRDPLALRLMLRDAQPSLYLGRPCYHGGARQPPCRPWLWTHGRYSEPVVASMAAALTAIVEANRVREVTLIGYSGGGVLAMLLAPRVPGVVAVITVAANLDIDAWAGLHGYSPLQGSLNPAQLPALPARIRQHHFAGSRDREAPPAVTRAGLRTQHGAEVHEIPGADHRCCWVERWPDLLRQADARPAAGIAPPATDR
jgi:hypothetical protein